MESKNTVDVDSLLKYVVFFGTAAACVLLNSRNKPKTEEVVAPTVETDENAIHILYASTTGTARGFANTLSHHITQRLRVGVNVIDLSTLKEDALPKSGVLIFLLSSWTGGTLPEPSQPFMAWLKDTSYDFRVSKDYLSAAKFSVFGLGNKLYGENYGKAAFEVDECLDRLGASRLAGVSLGDDGSDLEQAFYKWSSRVVKAIATEFDIQLGGGKKAPAAATAAASATASSTCCKSNNKNSTSTTSCTAEDDEPCCSTQAAPNTTEDDEREEEDEINDLFVEFEEDGEGEGEGEGDEAVLDVEELGSTLARAKAATAVVNDGTAREMVTKLQRKALTKEGYKIIGSHSAVKLCRWTKNQLRGRGGCYKHSFYGITSYQCMEATPSLACANKCVFCWRHHKNPVGTEWRWKTDLPTTIVEEAIKYHVGMINEFKGVPGVHPDRLQEARTVRHCALSLVGEPIMYPRINEMLQELHARKISTFMVTNAQFPDKIDALDPVTQLYVSIDAATKESLKAVDRPLFADFWERYQASLRALQKKLQRTVYRMTLVKAWNMTELESYAQLIEAGTPDFIEIKAVTYCGKSDASSLTMENVPWHADVCEYAEQLCARISARGMINIRYSIATEHEHSCCILIAREDKFKLADGWYTWIDYDTFDRLIQEYYDSNRTKIFRSEDYRAKTPEWALYKSKEKGFDPVENRWRKNAPKK